MKRAAGRRAVDQLDGANLDNQMAAQCVEPDCLGARTISRMVRCSWRPIYTERAGARGLELTDARPSSFRQRRRQGHDGRHKHADAERWADQVKEDNRSHFGANHLCK